MLLVIQTAVLITIGGIKYLSSQTMTPVILEHIAYTYMCVYMWVVGDVKTLLECEIHLLSAMIDLSVQSSLIIWMFPKWTSLKKMRLFLAVF